TYAQKFIEKAFVEGSPAVVAITNAMLKYSDLAELSSAQIRQLGEKVLSEAGKIVLNQILEDLKVGTTDSAYSNFALDVAKIVTIPLQVISPAVTKAVQFGDYAQKAIAAA